MRLALILTSFVFIFGCGTAQQILISDKENAWIADGALQNKDLYYCMARKSHDDKLADPACFKAKMLSPK